MERANSQLPTHVCRALELRACNIPYRVRDTCRCLYMSAYAESLGEIRSKLERSK